MNNRRLHPTLADYVAIAINPVLVMGLVGSLIYFLLEVLYQGAYPDRLQFCLTMFIFAIVLISRIAMEEGFEHAAPFGFALAVVVALALNRFVDYGHGMLANFSWLINWSLMGLTWWCAHQLTWDSTILDDDQQGESQGLLETVGIDRAGGEPPPQASAADAALETGTPRRGMLAGWERALNRKGKPHAPGVWVVYFSLASLPIFGIGQLLIPAANKPSRRYVFALLCVYVACGLGLLLTTSFLALRRYLRRRRLEMPPIMAGTWLASGGILIIVLLVLVALLPRPNPEYPISELPLRFTSHEQSSSQLALGQEGTRDAGADQGSGSDHAHEPADESNSDAERAGQAPGSSSDRSSAPGNRDEQRPADQQPGRSDNSQGSNGGGQSQSKPTQEGKAGSQQSQPGQGQSEQAQSEKGKPAASQSGSSQSNSKQTDSAQSKPSKSDRVQRSDSRSASKSKPGAQGTPAPNQDGAKPSPGSPAKAEQRPSPPASAPPTPAPSPGVVFGFLAVIFKWLFYGAVLGAMIYFGWQNRETLRAMFLDAMAQCRELWTALFGTRKKKQFVLAAPPGAVLEEKRYLRFVDYLDPFASGSQGQYSPPELVKYTFAALEAWGRDHQCPRLPDMTPHEFVRQLGEQYAPLAADSRLVADLYCRAVYSSAALPTQNPEQVRRLWLTLRSINAQLAEVART